eukprot:gene14315-20299_t
MVLNLTVATFDDKVVSIQVDDSLDIETVKAVIEAETNIPTAQQVLVLGTKMLKDGTTLAEGGVVNGDVLQVLPAQAAQPAQGRQAGGGQQQGQASLALNPDGSAQSPVAFIHGVKNDRATMGSLRVNSPQLAKLIEDEDVSGLQDFLRRSHVQKAEGEKRKQEAIARLNQDPFDVEAQRAIEEEINKKNIDENLELATEHSPELFGSVCMLYVKMEVGGFPVKAFVDSGAQMTIMTAQFAEACHLSRLIDKRFHGTAVGVGSSKIIGKIHQCPAVVGGFHIATSITVLEQKSGPQFIFGLENMKKHQCCIDLEKNVLRFGSCAAQLPFLPEHEIPKEFEHALGDPTGASGSGSDPTPAPAPAPAAEGSSAMDTTPIPATASAAGPDPKVEHLMGL